MPDRPRAPFPSPAPKEALEYFRFRGLRVGFDYRDVWQEEHAFAFTVAKAMEFDLLKEIRAALDRALGEDRTFRRFRKELTPALRKRGWWGKKEMRDPLTGETVRARLGSPRRLRTIYRANLRAARAAGVRDRAQRTKRTHPYFLYEPGPRKKGRDDHEAWAGTLLPVDHPWWNDHFPPNGWRCRCRVRPLTEAEARRRGGPTEPPPRREVDWRNERTGRIEKVDEGLDPAWATNPGKHRAHGPLGYLKEELDPDEAAFARAAIESVLDSPIQPQFRTRPHGDLPAGVFDEEVRDWIGARTRLARLADEIMEKQLGRWRKRYQDGRPVYRGHGLTVDEYRLLPRLIEQPQLVLRYMPTRPISKRQLALRLNLVSEVGGNCYNIVIGRVPGDPDRVDLISFHRIGGGRPLVDRMIRKAETEEDGQRVFRNSLPPRE